MGRDRQLNRDFVALPRDGNDVWVGAAALSDTSIHSCAFASRTGEYYIAKDTGRNAHNCPAAHHFASDVAALCVDRFARSPSTSRHVRKAGGAPTGEFPWPAHHPRLDFYFMLIQNKAERDFSPVAVRFRALLARTKSGAWEY